MLLHESFAQCSSRVVVVLLLVTPMTSSSSSSSYHHHHHSSTTTSSSSSSSSVVVPHKKQPSLHSSASSSSLLTHARTPHTGHCRRVLKTNNHTPSSVVRRRPSSSVAHCREDTPSFVRINFASVPCKNSNFNFKKPSTLKHPEINLTAPTDRSRCDAMRCVGTENTEKFI